MNFSQVVAEVRLITKRPELDNQIKRQVNAAISLFTYDTEFVDDFAEDIITLDGAEIAQSFSKSGLTRFRKFKYLKRGGTSFYLTRLGDKEIVNGCADRRDKFYEVGTSVNIFLKNYANTLDVGWMQYPPLLTGALDANEYWMLDRAPYMVIDKAASIIFGQIGDEAGMNSYGRQANEAYRAFRKDYALTTEFK